MTLRCMLLLCLIAAPLWANADADYQALLDDFKGKRWSEALARAEAFIEKHPEHRYLDAAHYMGANAGLNARQHDRAEALYRAMLEKHADSRHIEKARNELVSVLEDSRKLQECIVQCEANLKAAATSRYAERWQYLIGACNFRLWEFKKAELQLSEFIKQHPTSSYVRSARNYLQQINPPLKLDDSGIVKGYGGKFTEDVRFRRALENLPKYVAEAWDVLKRTLGVDLKGAQVVFEFRDKGYSSSAARAITETIAVDYKPFTRMVFYTEYIVTSEADFRSRVIHELKHAAFRDIMGQQYLNLPKWVREGLAVYGAEQLNDRASAILSNRIFGGRDARAVIDGLDDADHSTEDYLEDACAFLWLESRGKGNVHTFCRRLLQGQAHGPLFAELAKMELPDALDAASAFAGKYIDERMGKAEAAYAAIRNDENAARRARAEVAWFSEGGIARYEAWLKKNPDHVLTADCLYRLGKALIATGRHEAGRARMARVVAEHQLTSTICDDAMYWIARSYELQGRHDQSAATWGVILRDYSWSRPAIQHKDKYKPAGPVREAAGD